LLRRPEDIALYNKAFAVFWERRAANVVEPDEQLIRLTIEIDDETDGADDSSSQDADDDGESITIRFSSVETLRTKDFATYSDDELHLAQDLMSKLRLVGSPRNSFRMRSTAKGSRPDLRQTVRSSLRSGGEPIRRHWQENDERLRRLILLLDVSGSMEPYARALLRFVQAAVAGRQKVEAFAIGTRLTRVTRELGSRDPDKALKLAADRVVDWSGGTRLGECIRNFNDEWWCHRGRSQRRMGPRRPRTVVSADATPTSREPQFDLGQSVEGFARVRPACSRHGCRPTSC
jgi:uncharacterized protein with von Willebrand factor type A (vWA) domain